jgi:hypothetical protein
MEPRTELMPIPGCINEGESNANDQENAPRYPQNPAQDFIHAVTLVLGVPSRYPFVSAHSAEYSPLGSP